jgi:hypothetical protein
MGFASIVTNLNVINAIAKYAPDVLRINMTAKIVANFTVSIVFHSIKVYRYSSVKTAKTKPHQIWLTKHRTGKRKKGAVTGVKMALENRSL